MKLLPIIGSLLLLASPVQAFETFEELDKACGATKENTNLCEGAGNYVAATMMVSLLCHLEKKGRLTKENLVLTLDEWYEPNKGGSPLYNEAVDFILEYSPDCSIKP